MKTALSQGRKILMAETPADVDELLYGAPQFMPGGSSPATWEVIPIEPIPVEDIKWLPEIQRVPFVVYKYGLDGATGRCLETYPIATWCSN